VVGRLAGWLSLALLVAAAAGAPDRALPEEERRAFAWFDGLGYPDLAHAPFVRMTGGTLPEYGFLLDDDATAFRVFTVGLETVRKRVACERLSLADYVRNGLRHLAHPPEHEWPWEFEPFGHRRYEPTLWFRVFVFARACARQGHADLARRLWTLMEADAYFRGDETTLRAVQEQVAYEALRFVRLDFGDPGRSWADLLARCRWWKERFAALPGSAWVNAMIPMLERIVAPPAGEPEDRVARLILHLCDTSMPRGVAAGPAQELVRLGHAAVPQLLDAWDDERPCRCVWWERRFKGYYRRPVRVVRVGAQVRAIVGKIAGHEFADAVEARLWDAGVRGLEEKAVLVRMVSDGCEDAATGARLLLERYPDAAEAAILAGLARARDGFGRALLVRQLHPIRTEATTRFLLDEIRAADPGRRALAAWLLLDRGRAEGVTAVAEAWRSGSEWWEVSEFLCDCGRSEAAAALEERFDAVSLDTRFDIVSRYLLGRSWPVPDAEPPAPDAKWEAAVESLLVHALADAHHMRGWTGRKAGTSVGCDGYNFGDPRVCDVAACALKEKFPDRYDFQLGAPVAERDGQLLAFRNRWRAAHGLPALPPPAPK